MHLSKPLQCCLSGHTQNTTERPPLQPGQLVRVQDQSGKWQPAVVKDKAGEPRSYIVASPSGQELRRNRVHIRPSPEHDATPLQDAHPPPETSVKPTNNQQNVQPQSTTNAQPGDQTHYQTRSGRFVKPPSRYDDQ